MAVVRQLGCPGKLWMSHHWKCWNTEKSDFVKDIPDHDRGVGLDLERSLPSQTFQ